MKLASRLFSPAPAALLLALPSLAFAADAYSNPINVSTIAELINRLVDFAQVIMIPLAALAIIIAAFIYTTSAGDPARIQQGHRALTYGIVGFAIVAGAQFIQDVVIGVAGNAVGQNLAAFINNLVRAAGGVLMGVSVVMILYAAFLFITGGADPQRRITARNVLVYSLVGVALAIFAFAIPNLIRNFIKSPPKAPPNFGGSDTPVETGQDVNPFFDSGTKTLPPDEGPAGNTEPPLPEFPTGGT